MFLNLWLERLDFSYNTFPVTMCKSKAKLFEKRENTQLGFPLPSWDHSLRSEKKFPFPESFRFLQTPAVASTTVGWPGSWGARMEERKYKTRGK